MKAALHVTHLEGKRSILKRLLHSTALKSAEVTALCKGAAI